MQRRTLCLCGLVSGALAASCSSNTKAPLTFAMIPKASDNIVFTMGNAGAQALAGGLSESGPRQVTVKYMAPTTLDSSGALEADQLNQSITDRVDGVLISCVNDSALSPMIDQAVASKIPVITFDSDCPSSRRTTYYSIDNEATGATGADLLAKLMGSGSKTVGILTGQPSENLDKRIAGFTTRLASTYPGVTVADTVRCNEDATCGFVVESMVQQYPDLDGLFLVGDWGLAGGCSSDGSSCTDDLMPNWKAAAKVKLKTVAFDSLPFELTLVQQGYVGGLIGQKYFGWGYVGTSLLFNLVTGTPVAAGFMDSGFDVVCSNNVDVMVANWKNSDFKQPLPPCSLLPSAADAGP